MGDTFVAYRAPVKTGKGGRPGLLVVLVNRGHSAYVKDGQSTLKLPGVKAVTDGNMAWCLDQLEELGFFAAAQSAGSLAAALTERADTQVVVVERGGKVRVLAAVPPKAGDGAAIEAARRFSRIKMVIVQVSQEQTSFQLVPNREGGDYFSRQKRKLAKEREGGGR